MPRDGLTPSVSAGNRPLDLDGSGSMRSITDPGPESRQTKIPVRLCFFLHSRCYNETEVRGKRMKKLVPFLLTATLCFAGGIPSQNIRGEYIEARTADVYTGPCFPTSKHRPVPQLALSLLTT